MKKKKKLTGLISALNESKFDVIPENEGWFTTAELAEELRVSIGYASKMILKGQRNGILEMKRFRCNRNGAARIVPHFRKK